MDIKISAPIQVEFDLLESDDRLPSVKFRFFVDTARMASSLHCSGEIWITCSAFDCFLSGLVEGERPSRLASIDERFLLEIVENDRGIFFCWSWKLEGSFSFSTSSFVEIPINEDEISAIRNVFDSFPKWW